MSLCIELTQNTTHPSWRHTARVGINSRIVVPQKETNEETVHTKL